MAQTLKFGNGTWATKKGSTLAYNDEDGNFKPLPFTYTGAGKGTRVNKEGLIEVVENDKPRIDYTDSEDGVFLLEKAATNYDSDSTNFTISYMSNSNGIQSSSLVSENSPSGDNNSVYKISKVTDSSDPYIGRSGVNFTSTEMVFSVWLWTDENQPKDVILLIYRDGISELTTKKITLTTTPTRYFVQKTFSNTPSVVSYRIDLTESSSNQYIYAWGKQVEGGNIASSYIPTQGTIQTRVQETNVKQVVSNSVINQTQGTIFYDINLNNITSNSQYVGVLSDGTSTNRIQFLNNTSQDWQLFISASTISNNINLTADTNGELRYKIAISYESGNVCFFINGFKIGTSTETFTFNNLLHFDLGQRYDDDYFLHNPINEVALYDDRQTDLELETLTSYRTWEAMVKELNLNIIHNE